MLFCICNICVLWWFLDLFCTSMSGARKGTCLEFRGLDPERTRRGGWAVNVLQRRGRWRCHIPNIDLYEDLLWRRRDGDVLEFQTPSDRTGRIENLDNKKLLNILHHFYLFPIVILTQELKPMCSSGLSSKSIIVHFSTPVNTYYFQ
jgi:hypothetical protein